MFNDYEDIRSKLGEPQWYDEHGVPRYCEFGPRRCGIYPQFIAYVEIACQYCNLRFKVAVAVKRVSPSQILPTSNDIGSFHYGDPPNHGCIGDTMNCYPVRIVEFWRRDNPRFDWERDRSYELAYKIG